MTLAQPKSVCVPQILTVFKCVILTETTGSPAPAMKVDLVVDLVMDLVVDLVEVPVQGQVLEAVLVAVTQVLDLAVDRDRVEDPVAVRVRVLVEKTQDLKRILVQVPVAVQEVDLEVAPLNHSLKRISHGIQIVMMV